MNPKIKAINDYRIRHLKTVSAMAREIGIPHWVLRRAIQEEPAYMRDYYAAKIDAWLKSHESELKRGK